MSHLPARKLPNAEKGRLAEKQVEAWLREENATSLTFAFHRFPDARAARGALAAQPSDYLVVVNGVAIFLEVKSTENRTRLPRAKVTQYGSLKKFWWAGGKPLVLVYVEPRDSWVVIDEDQLFPPGDTPTSFPTAHLEGYSSPGQALSFLKGAYAGQQ